MYVAVIPIVPFTFLSVYVVSELYALLILAIFLGYCVVLVQLFSVYNFK